MTMKKLSIISPCFNEIENIRACHEAVKAIFEIDPLSGMEREHIIVDDFSTDGTRRILKEIAAADPNVKVVFNARNYGVYRTAYHGLKYASGDLVVPMLPVDLQDPPAFIVDMVKYKCQRNISVVYGIRYQRNENIFMKWIRRAYYVLLVRSASVKIPMYAGEFQVIDRWVAEKVIEIDDYYPFIRGRIANITSDSEGMHYTWQSRKHGRTKHNWIILYDHGVNGLISTSILPMRIMVFLGFIICAASILLAFLQLLAYLALDSTNAARGIPMVITGLFFMVGILFTFLGIMGEYISAIHSQIRGFSRPVAMETLNISQ